MNLDALVQKWACTQLSIISNRPAECAHHYFSRSHEIIRYDIRNLIPLTLKEHTLVHVGKIILENPYEDELRQLCNKGIKQFLLENSITKKEWLKERENFFKMLLTAC
ncbi:MAG: hypothetical protein NC124_02100 [Clostridium sp.]|nr:hypothetical protein [Clostridium sp.]